MKCVFTRWVAVVLSMTWLYAAKPSGGEQRNGARKAAAGVQTPGVRIPFTALKPEMEFESGATAWIAIAGDLIAPDGDRLMRIDGRAKEKKLADPVEGVRGACGGAVEAFGSLWTGACDAKAIARIDPKAAKVTATLPVGIGPARQAITASADSVWALTDARGTLSRIDPQQNTVVAELRVPADCGSLAFAENALWVACPAENRVLRIDPQTNLVVKSIEVAAQPEALAAGQGSVWALCAKDGKVERIDPKTNKTVKTVDLAAPAAGGSVAFGEGSLWISMLGFPLTRIDPETDQVAQQFFGGDGGAVQAAMGSVWLARAGKIWRLDPKRIAATLAE